MDTINRFLKEKIPWVATNTRGDDKDTVAGDASTTIAGDLHPSGGSVCERQDDVGVPRKSKWKLRDLIQEVAESHGLEKNSIQWYFNSDTREGSIRIRTIWPRAKHLSDIELAVYGTSSEDQACETLYKALQNWVSWLVDVYEVLGSFIESRPGSKNCRAKVTVLIQDLTGIGSDGKSDERNETEFGPVFIGLVDKPYRYGETEFWFRTPDDSIDNAVQHLRMIEEQQLQADQDMHNTANYNRPISVSRKSLGVILEEET